MHLQALGNLGSPFARSPSAAAAPPEPRSPASLAARQPPQLQRDWSGSASRAAAGLASLMGSLTSPGAADKGECVGKSGLVFLGLNKAFLHLTSQLRPNIASVTSMFSPNTSTNSATNCVLSRVCGPDGSCGGVARKAPSRLPSLKSLFATAGSAGSVKTPRSPGTLSPKSSANLAAVDAPAQRSHSGQRAAPLATSTAAQLAAPATAAQASNAGGNGDGSTRQPSGGTYDSRRAAPGLRTFRRLEGSHIVAQQPAPIAALAASAAGDGGSGAAAVLAAGQDGFLRCFHLECGRQVHCLATTL